MGGGPSVIRRGPTDGLVVGVPSMSAVGHQLLAACGKDLELHTDRTARVAGSKGEQWHVRWSRGRGNAGQIRTRPELAKPEAEQGADFDSVVLAYEANKVQKGCG